MAQLTALKALTGFLLCLFSFFQKKRGKLNFDMVEN
jgi:hypothetical protein